MKSKLEKIAGTYIVEKDFDSIGMKYNFNVASEYLAGKTFLELGCATGESTVKIVELAESIDVVEGSKKNIETTRQKIAKIKHNASVAFFNDYWERFDYPKNKYSDVIFFRGLEHLADPSGFLRLLKVSLPKESRLHIVVPNAHSFHRKIGVAMGLLKGVYDLNDRDRAMGHFRVFDYDQLVKLLNESGYVVLASHGIMLKFLPNVEMQDIVIKNPAIADALFEVGKEFPQNCSEVYVCAIPK